LEPGGFSGAKERQNCGEDEPLKDFKKRGIEGAEIRIKPRFS
jgi:hypothetical protein